MPEVGAPLAAPPGRRRHPSAWTRVWVSGPALLVLAALAIDLAAGRWGAYVRTPINGLYLADALFALGSLWGISRVRSLRGLPRDVIAVFVVCAAYLMVRGAAALLGDGAVDRYAALRDLAPFAFLALVPLAAAALTAVSFRVVLWVVRASTLAHAALGLLVAVGLLVPFGSSILGSEEVLVFSVRGDLFGVIAGIGFVSWGSWPGVSAASRPIQVALIAVTATSESRAALVTFVFCVGADLWRERRWWSWPSWVAALLAGVGIAVVLLLVGIPRDTGSTVDDGKAATPESANPFSGSALTKLDAGGPSTTQARIRTYSMVVEALAEDGLWVAGDGPGSDILYEICTGLENPPDALIVVDETGEQIFLPKCPVDSGLSSVLRDPHQWVLNSMIYHGVLGTVPLALALLWPLWRLRRTRHSSLSIVGVVAYLVCASFGVILSSPFGSLPIAVLLAWLLASSTSSRDDSKAVSGRA